jgi:hypothetical protein
MLKVEDLHAYSFQIKSELSKVSFELHNTKLADEEVLVLTEKLLGETDSCLWFQFDSQFLQS